MNINKKLEELIANTYRSDSNAVCVPTSANDDANAAAFHVDYDVAIADSRMIPTASCHSASDANAYEAEDK